MEFSNSIPVEFSNSNGCRRKMYYFFTNKRGRERLKKSSRKHCQKLHLDQKNFLPFSCPRELFQIFFPQHFFMILEKFIKEKISPTKINQIKIIKYNFCIHKRTILLHIFPKKLLLSNLQ